MRNYVVVQRVALRCLCRERGTPCSGGTFTQRLVVHRFEQGPSASLGTTTGMRTEWRAPGGAPSPLRAIFHPARNRRLRWPLRSMGPGPQRHADATHAISSADAARLKRERLRTLPARTGVRSSGDPAQQQKIPWRSRLKCWPACTEGDSIGVLARAFPFGVSAARLPSKPGGQARSTLIGQYGEKRNICQCHIAFSRIYDLRVNLHRAVARGVPGAVRAFRHQLRLSPNFPVRSLSFQAAFSPMISLSLMLEEAISRIDT